METRGFGTWPSPIAPADLATGQVHLDEVRADGADTWWLESRPDEAGRSVLVQHDGASGRRRDVLDAPWDVRSRVHEYGGGAYAVDAGTVVLQDLPTDRLHRLDPGAPEPVPITPASAEVRFGGLHLRAGVLLAVREDHRGPGHPRNTLVRLTLDGPNDDFGQVLVQGPDFVLRPALTADGPQVAWVEYDHPDMPWDRTRLRRATLTNGGLEQVRTVSDAGCSAIQPQWSDSGDLWFASDETGWWLLHRDTGSGTEQLHEQEADVASPQWALGMVDYALLGQERALVRRWVDGTPLLGVLDATTGSVVDLEGGGARYDHLGASGADVVLLRHPAGRAAEVVRGPLAGPLTVLSAQLPSLPPAWVSPAEPFSWRNGAGLTVHGLLHRPRNPEASGPSGAAPPLVVMVHGGPTSRAEGSFALGTQFWTTRGFAVLQVNHGGSTGHGRAYRNRLRGQWGVVDTDDITTGARAVADAGTADPSRLVIRGGSAGGFAVLRAMTTSRVFAAGTSYFGVADLAALAAETHKFESHYTDGLVAPWPEGEAVYRERSPLHHAADLSGEVLLLQGADDTVVPLAQAEAMAAAMGEAGREVELVVYDGEGHGFRRADSIVDSLTRELAFYVRVLGLGEPG